MANPRKFSEKIALHNHRQAEETARFEQIMKEVSDATARVWKRTLGNTLFLFWWRRKQVGRSGLAAAAPAGPATVRLFSRWIDGGRAFRWFRNFAERAYVKSIIFVPNSGTFWQTKTWTLLQQSSRPGGMNCRMIIASKTASDALLFSITEYITTSPPLFDTCQLSKSIKTTFISQLFAHWDKPKVVNTTWTLQNRKFILILMC